ncbi:MAG: hypothetical protein HRU28_00490 [Rhizobiales bacterium]|nr:hypothetical protein [Hyphomicrobiales bacterium]
MTTFIKLISTSVALIILTSSAAQAHHNVPNCLAKAFSEYNCGDDVYLANTPEAQCWENSQNAVKQCKKFHRKSFLKDYKVENMNRVNTQTNKAKPFKGIKPVKTYQLKKAQ